ncbi:MAG: hypothetical protein ACI3ZL_08960 [Candidatus Cryptobacteroides sp.]
MARLHSWPMVTIHAKKHDNYSVEFKFGFEDSERTQKNDFAVNTWIFVPNSIGINPESYGKDQFYRDIKSNVRLITPVYSLGEIADDDSLPLTSLRGAIGKAVAESSSEAGDEYEYHLKMFAAIFKSALRNAEHQFRSSKSPEKLSGIASGIERNCRAILGKYRSLYGMIPDEPQFDKARKYFILGDEFMSHIVEVRSLRVIKKMDALRHSDCLSEERQRLMCLVMEEEEYRKSKGYGLIGDDPEYNRQVVYHHGMLKKFVESDLYIGLEKKKDGVAVEQLYYSIAAGVAMIFATAVAWLTQVRFGNITWPLFIALVISYMMKDRIKELMRFYFAHKLGNKYYDKKAKISIGKKNVGFIKEGVDFISFEKTPGQVKQMRNDAATIDDASRIFEEKILLYRKRVQIDGKVLSDICEYPMKGINEIMRLHLTRFTQKMDNPEVPIDHLSHDGSISTVKVQKIYYLNVIFQLCHETEAEYHHFRILMTRSGILKVEEV